MTDAKVATTVLTQSIGPKVVWAVLLLVSACDVTFGLRSVPPPSPHHRKAITIKQQVTASLFDFPISVSLAGDPDLIAYVSADGTNLAFTDPDGVALDCEIVRYSAGTLEAWVRVPELPPAGITIEMVYGDGAGSCGGAATWNGPFIGVWHEPDANGVFQDRTLHNHHTSPLLPTQAPRIADGIVGGSGIFDGVDDATCEPSDGDQSLELGTSSFSYSVWVNTQSTATVNVALEKGGENPLTPGFDVELSTTTWNAWLSDGATVQGGRFVAGTLGEWVQLVAVVDRRDAVISTYTNGIASDAQPLGPFGSVSGTKQFCLGKPPSNPFGGLLDEPRVYSIALTADWIAAEYANLATRSTFMTIGVDEAY